MVKYKEKISNSVTSAFDYLIENIAFCDEKQLLNEQIRNTDAKIILDIGTGDAKYLKYSAKSKWNRDRRYIAIDIQYQNGHVPKKRDNVEYVAADAQYLPFKDESIDLTTSFYFPYEDDEIFSEMHRVTKSDGCGINSVLSDRLFSMFPCEPQESERLKTLVMESNRIGYDHCGPHWHNITPRPEKLSIKYDEIKEIMTHPVEDIFHLFGLKVIQKSRADPKVLFQILKTLHIISPEFMFPIKSKTDRIYNINEQIKYPLHSYVWVKEGDIDEDRQIFRTKNYSGLIEQLENHFQIDANEPPYPQDIQKIKETLQE